MKTDKSVVVTYGAYINSNQAKAAKNYINMITDVIETGE
jgi:hypothetical protein